MSRVKLRLIRIMLVSGTLGCPFLTPTSAAAAELDLEHLHGRVVYLDFWASWCLPCRASFPWMQQLQETYGPQGLTIVAINLDHERSDAERFLTRFHPGFELVFDPAGRWAERFHVQGMPTSVLLDRKGARRFEHIGFKVTDATTYDEEVRELLAEK